MLLIPGRHPNVLRSFTSLETEGCRNEGSGAENSLIVASKISRDFRPQRKQFNLNSFWSHLFDLNHISLGLGPVFFFPCGVFHFSDFSLWEGSFATSMFCSQWMYCLWTKPTFSWFGRVQKHKVVESVWKCTLLVWEGNRDGFRWF